MSQSPNVARKPPNVSLTKRRVEKVQPEGRPVFVWDTDVHGFGLHVAKSGLKTFIYQYRTVDDLKSRRYTIGRFGTWTVEAARKEARDLAMRVSKGGDPVSGRRDTRTAETMDKLFDLYLKEHAATKNAASTLNSVSRLLMRAIRPVLGPVKVSKISRSEIARMHHGLKETPRQANHALAVVSKALSLAEVWGMRPINSNPCGSVARYPETHRKRFLTGGEITRVGLALEEAETSGLPWRIKEATARSKRHAKPENQRTTISWQAVAVIRMLLMTGARLSEITGLEKSHFDVEAATIALPGAKGGGREAHPISRHVMTMIQKLPVVEGSPWLFPRDDNPHLHVSVSVIENAWQRIRIRADVEDVRIHDLRHTVGTYASQAGVNAFIVRDLLRHKNVSTTNRYSNFDADPVRHVSDAVGSRIAAALGGVISAEIIPLRAGGR